MCFFLILLDFLMLFIVFFSALAIYLVSNIDKYIHTYIYIYVVSNFGPLILTVAKATFI